MTKSQPPRSNPFSPRTALPLLAFAFLCLLLTSTTSAATEPSPIRELDAHRHHLGLAGSPPEWRDLDDQPAEAEKLTVNFEAKANAQPATLFIRQRGVRRIWPVLLNGRKLGNLYLSESDVIAPLAIAPGLLLDGGNTLSILSPGVVDDIFIEDIRLDSRPISDALNEASLRVQVSEKGATGPLPCRMTIVDAASGALVPIYAAPGQRLAVRPGVVYTGDGKAVVGLAAGKYTVFATRGFEYGVASRQVTLAAGQTMQLDLEIAHEVRLPGWTACDTHIHTFTNSHHGDATLDERALTLAGEGIELAITTDHNFYTDLRESARRMQVDNRFTTAIGDEVTTKVGHFIAFPVASTDAPLPTSELTEWPALMASIRSVPGVQVVILNHPRDTYWDFIPFGPANFNPVTGDSLRFPEFSFDAVEVANAGTLQSDFMQSYRDWFALLNHGYRVAAIGSSDSHDVARYTVGQGRSYIACDDSAPGRIDVDAACRRIKDGRVSVSLGLFTQMRVDDRFGPGDLASGLGSELHVNVRVLGPRWVRAEKVELFSDGVKIREQAIHAPDDAVEKIAIDWHIPRPSHDVHLVAIASGPGVDAPYWSVPPPWQPQDRVRAPHVIGSTNPIWIDADGDGKYTSPRDYAKALLQAAGPDPARLIPALHAYDEAVAAQAASLCQSTGHDVRDAAFAAALPAAAPSTQAGFSAFIQTLPKP